MKIPFYFVVIAVIVFVLGTDAQQRGRGRGGRGRGRGGGRRGGRPPGGRVAANVTQWEREVDGETVEQIGVVRANEADGQGLSTGGQVLVTTKGPGLKNLTLIPGVVLYDFTNISNPTVVLRIGYRRGPCFVLPLTTGLDFDSASQTVIDRNGTTVTDPLAMLELNGTSDPLDDTAVQALPDTVQRFCGKRIVQAEQPDSALPAAGSEDEGQQVKTTLTLDSKVTILMKSRQGRPGNPRGPVTVEGETRAIDVETSVARVNNQMPLSSAKLELYSKTVEKNETVQNLVITNRAELGNNKPCRTW